MGLRIRTNVDSITAQRALSSSNQELSQATERLASGSRINRSADDAAGLAVSESLRAKTRGLNQARRNANDGISLVQVAESGMSEMTNILVRLRELAVQASSDTVGMTERGFLNKEYSQLVDEIDRIGSATEFNGRNLFSPDLVDGLDIQVGYTSDSAVSSLKLTFGDGVALNSEGFKLRDVSIEQEKGRDIVGALDNIDAAIGTISNNRATLGALQSRLNSAISNLSVTTESMMASNSRIRDADFAEETARATQGRILSQAGISVLSQANARPEMALALLR
jgi:flagellin